MSGHRPSDVMSMKKPSTSPAPAMAALSDDLLAEFFIRLPDLPSLASASLVSKRWRRVASDPALRRRFNRFRRPPLLGVIFSDRGDEHFPRRCPKLRFVPCHTGHPRHVWAAGVGDFLFDDLPDDFSKKIGGGRIRRNDEKWRLRGTDGGLLLLSRGGGSRDLAVYDPFARTAVFFPPPDVDVLRKWWHMLSYAIITDEADGSFRVIAALFLHDLEAAVFSSRTRDWNAVPADGLEFDNGGRSDGIRAGRFAYWRSDSKKKYDDVEEIFVLDIHSMEWSVITAPFDVGESYCVADVAEHGGLCLVSSKQQCLQIWVRECDDDDEWVIKKELCLLKEFGVLKNLRMDEWMRRVRPLAVRGDYVLMEFWSIRKSHSYLLMLNLRTMRLDKYRNDATEPYRGTAFPLFLLPELPLPDLTGQKTFAV